MNGHRDRSKQDTHIEEVKLDMVKVLGNHKDIHLPTIKKAMEEADQIKAGNLSRKSARVLLKDLRKS